MQKIIFGTILLLIIACGQESTQLAPPLLLDNSGLGKAVTLADSPLDLEDTVNGVFPASTPFAGHVMAATAGSRLHLELDCDSRAMLAIYGPRNCHGLFGQALSWRVSEGPAGVGLSVELDDEGDYLILVGAFDDTANRPYRLRSICLENCTAPKCPAITCGVYCVVGLDTDGEGCPICDCVTGCTQDVECPLGWLCTQGICRPEPTCDCGQSSYAPVCGQNGHSYANACELACAQVPLDHEGLCETPECTSDTDCPISMHCHFDGSCIDTCDCEGQTLSLVCGSDGLTYPNDCERSCAGISLNHLGACEECGQEICDGRDNDCDGFIDEGCSGTCDTNADCPGGTVCMSSICVQALPCMDDSGCPSGQVCLGGFCALAENCFLEICDGLDNDCDGLVDEGCPACRGDADCASGEICVEGLCIFECNTDEDGDGYLSELCDGPDCDDNDAAINPGALEICDEVDNNCDGQVDEGCGQFCRTDDDCLTGEICIEGTCTLP